MKEIKKKMAIFERWKKLQRRKGRMEEIGMIWTSRFFYSLSPTSSRKLIKLKYLLKIQGGPVEFSSLREREREVKLYNTILRSKGQRDLVFILLKVLGLGFVGLFLQF